MQNSYKVYRLIVLIYYSIKVCFVAKKRETEDSSDDEPLAKKAKSEAPSVFTIIHRYFQENNKYFLPLFLQAVFLLFLFMHVSSFSGRGY